jgi:hypothetical protein
MRFAPWAALAALMLLGMSQSQAQPPGRPPGSVPITQPTFSPYLNLLRRDNSAALNYYGLVRPEIEFRNSLLGLQQQVTLNRMALNQEIDPATGLPATGHTAYFLNLGGYFLNLGGGTAGSGTRSFGGTGAAGFGGVGATGLAGGQVGQPSLTRPASGAAIPRR